MVDRKVKGCQSQRPNVWCHLLQPTQWDSCALDSKFLRVSHLWHNQYKISHGDSSIHKSHLAQGAVSGQLGARHGQNLSEAASGSIKTENPPRWWEACLRVTTLSQTSGSVYFELLFQPLESLPRNNSASTLRDADTEGRAVFNKAFGPGTAAAAINFTPCDKPQPSASQPFCQNGLDWCGKPQDLDSVPIVYPRFRMVSMRPLRALLTVCATLSGAGPNSPSFSKMTFNKKSNNEE